MTLRICAGIDPGMSGAIAVLADGSFDVFVDMPLMQRAAGGNHVNAASLAASLRGIIARHPGAYVYAALEAQSARPGQGVSTMFRMGEGYGVIRGVLGALGIPFATIQPQTWKRFMRLSGTEKDVARTMAITRFPDAAPMLNLKKHVGRSDAILIAAYAELTEQSPR